jgi:Zn-dependent protease with chaperone function
MRLVALVLFVAFLCNAALPAPVRAMSTATEISKGAAISQAIDRESLLVDDPFLTNWVSGVGANLAKYRAREDITYTFRIINSDEINAFALPGGFVHVDMGLLNTVSSDDELAGVMAHEMGHVERRHAVTLQEKANILGVLIGVLSILSPIAYALGGYGGDLAMNKFSRQDELQADQYGLLLMSRAGYDPQAMIDFMDQLRQMEETPETPTDKWMEGHPVPSDRISHLEGYPQLDRPTADQVAAQAIHDEDEGRYSYSQVRFEQALKIDPNDALAAQHLAQVQVALKNSDMHAGANAQFAAAFDADQAARTATAALVQSSINITRDDLAIARQQEKLGRQDSESLFTQLQSLSGGVPNLGHPKKPDNNLATAIAGLNHVVQDINGTLDLSSDVMSAAPGLIDDNLIMLHELAGPLRDGTTPPAVQSVMQYYPTIAAQLTTSSDELVRAIDRARGAVTSGTDGVKLIKDYFILLDQIDTTSGDIKDADMPRVRAALTKAQSAWDEIKATALRADDEVYAAQSRWLSAHLSLLDLTSSPERYAAYRRAMAYRFPGVVTPDYATAQRSAVSAGEVGCLAWLSFETKQPVDQLLAQEQATGEACEDMALAKGLLTESMEIGVGLLYYDYIDKPHAPKQSSTPAK